MGARPEAHPRTGKRDVPLTTAAAAAAFALASAATDKEDVRLFVFWDRPEPFELDDGASIMLCLLDGIGLIAPPFADLKPFQNRHGSRK